MSRTKRDNTEYRESGEEYCMRKEEGEQNKEQKKGKATVMGEMKSFSKCKIYIVLIRWSC